MNKQKSGIVLIVVGFTIIVINAADYLGGFFGLSLAIQLPSSAIGIVFVALGMNIQSTKSKKS